MLYNHIYLYIIVIYAWKTSYHVSGFSNYTQKSNCVLTRKSFTSVSLEERQAEAEKPRPVVFEVTGQLFAYSTNLLQHVTVYKQYSQHPLRGAGVSWTHTYTHWTERYDDGWSDYSYVLSDDVLWQWTTGGLHYTILYSLASEHKPKRLKRLHLWLGANLWVKEYIVTRCCSFLITTNQT